MFASVLIYLYGTPPVQHIANVAARNHREAINDQIEVEEVLHLGKDTQVNRYTIYREGAEKIAILVRPSKGTAKRYIFAKNQLVTVEVSTQKYVVNSTDKSEPIAKIIDENLEIDLFPKLLMLPDGMDEWKSIFSATSNWKAVYGKPIVRLDSGGTFGELSLDIRSNRIGKFVNRTSDIRSDWTIHYKPLTDKSVFSPPKNGYQVVALTDPAAMPKMDKATSGVVNRMLRLYEPPKSLALQITDSDEITKIFYTKKGVRQEGQRVSFTYNGKNLLVSANGSTYHGASQPSDVFDAVANAGSRVDPILRDLILGVNPIRRMLETVSSLKTIGTSDINGQACTILQGKSQSVTLTLYVTKSDYQVRRITTSAPGSINYESSRDFLKINDATDQQVKVAPSSNALPISRLLN